MAISKVRKNFHQARWDEPMIYELSTPGVRGILPPPIATIFLLTSASERVTGLFLFR